MKPLDLKGLSERRVEPMAQLEGMVSTCQMETRAFNEEEQVSYSRIPDEVRSINTALNAAEQDRTLSQVECRAAAVKEVHTQEELENHTFGCYVRGIAPKLEIREVISMTAGDNGAAIPISITNKVIRMVKEVSPLHQRVAYYNVGRDLTIPSYDESTQKITMVYATEFTALTSTSGRFTSIFLSGFLTGASTKVSISLVNDSKFDIVSCVIRKMAEAVAERTENELTSGTTSKVEDLPKVAANVTAAAVTTVTADGLIDLQESTPDALQINYIRVMSQAARKAIRELKDADGNYPLNKGFTAKWGYSLLGRDVYVSRSIPDMAVGRRAVFYLDPTGLTVKASKTPSIQTLREKFADEYAVGVICWMEADSKVENKQKAAVLAMNTGA